MKCLLPECLRETTGKPVEQSQRGAAAVDNYVSANNCFSGEAFPCSQQCQSYIINYSGWVFFFLLLFFLHSALGGNKILTTAAY